MKIDFGVEKYFEKLPKRFRTTVLKFFTTNNRLQEETGRRISITHFVLYVTSQKLHHNIFECGPLSNIRKEYLHIVCISQDLMLSHFLKSCQPVR